MPIITNLLNLLDIDMVSLLFQIAHTAVDH